MRSLYSLGLLILLISFTSEKNPNFLQEQLNFRHVHDAFQEKEFRVKALLRAKNIDTRNYDMFIRGFKFEEDLEIWAKNKNVDTFTLITTYKWCNNVGILGPKRSEGDLQIPEGIYHLSKFNPESAYYLSLKVSYPNKSDSILGNRYHLGGMIFIHGGCKTIGCIPITDESIKELYVFCVQAKHSGQEQIPIHLFPARLTLENLNLLVQNQENEDNIQLWTNLKTCYDLFETNHQIPRSVVSPRGEYFFFEN